jgi:hypothetical protein
LGLLGLGVGFVGFGGWLWGVWGLGWEVGGWVCWVWGLGWALNVALHPMRPHAAATQPHMPRPFSPNPHLHNST